MANQEQLDILKQGPQAWNRWRDEQRPAALDLGEADLRKAGLAEADLSQADLSGSDLSEADLSGADLGGANLSRAILAGADLSRASLSGADLAEADLNFANFTGADLRLADLRGARLEYANLHRADFSEARLAGADFSRASAESTLFGRTDLGEALGLAEVRHRYPSTLGTDTLQLSRGKIPAVFLRGCGLSDFEIEAARLYDPGLDNQQINDSLYKIYDLRARQSIQVSPLFISYSHADAAFVDRLEIEFDARGIRFWRDIHDATAGRLETQIEQAIRHNPTVLVVLSRHSINSDWVQHEVRQARTLEKELRRDVLCPVALDEAWKSSPWPRRVIEQVQEYNILDFSEWQDEALFRDRFTRLLDGLELFYK